MANDKEIKLGENGVYRRRLGIGGFIVATGAFILGGFEFFTLQADQLWAMLGASGGLMGIGVAKDIFNKKQ